MSFLDKNGKSSSISAIFKRVFNSTGGDDAGESDYYDDSNGDNIEHENGDLHPSEEFGNNQVISPVEDEQSFEGAEDAREEIQISPTEDKSLTEDVADEQESPKEEIEPKENEQKPVEANLDLIALQGRDIGEQIAIENEVNQAVSGATSQSGANQASTSALQQYDSKDRLNMQQVLSGVDINLSDVQEVQDVKFDNSIHPDDIKAEGHVPPQGPSVSEINRLVSKKNS